MYLCVLVSFRCEAECLSALLKQNSKCFIAGLYAYVSRTITCVYLYTYCMYVHKHTHTHISIVMYSLFHRLSFCFSNHGNDIYYTHTHTYFEVAVMLAFVIVPLTHQLAELYHNHSATSRLWYISWSFPYISPSPAVPVPLEAGSSKSAQSAVKYLIPAIDELHRLDRHNRHSSVLLSLVTCLKTAVESGRACKELFRARGGLGKLLPVVEEWNEGEDVYCATLH